MLLLSDRSIATSKAEKTKTSTCKRLINYYLFMRSPRYCCAFLMLNVVIALTLIYSRACAHTYRIGLCDACLTCKHANIQSQKSAID